jgi:hypothetical protein
MYWQIAIKAIAILVAKLVSKQLRLTNTVSDWSAPWKIRLIWVTHSGKVTTYTLDMTTYSKQFCSHQFNDLHTALNIKCIYVNLEPWAFPARVDSWLSDWAATLCPTKKTVIEYIAVDFFLNQFFFHYFYTKQAPITMIIHRKNSSNIP